MWQNNMRRRNSLFPQQTIVFLVIASTIYITTLLLSLSLNDAVLAKVPTSFSQQTSLIAIAPSTNEDIEQLTNQISQTRDAKERRDQAFLIRLKIALFQRQNFSFDHPTNQDEKLYANQNFIGNFTKVLPHDSNGQVDPSAYSAELKAIETGNFADFEAIPLGGTVKLVNPEAAYAFELEGTDSHGLTMPAAPAFSSAETASEIAEDYWQAFTRDVPFSQYDNNPDTQAAAADLSEFSDFRGPKVNGQVTVGSLFRGNTPGDLTGPYVSQFLWLNVPYGLGSIAPLNSQRSLFPLPGQDYMTDYQEWLNIQNGQSPSRRTQLDSVPRYIHTSRDLTEYVHRDYPYLSFVNAALILLNFGPNALDPANPYLSANKQTSVVTFGNTDILDLVARVVNEALKAAWYQKWLVHRRLRPEEFGGWIDNQLNGRASYPINAEILNSPVLKQVHNKYGSYLLPQAYPEGAPAHPSYPAGHAIYSGACVTVLKAFFNESFVIPNPVVASEDGLSLNQYTESQLTVGGELNKLAANIALARDAAGVHWRSDGIEGLKLGEAFALLLLQDRTALYKEPFSGFTLTKFDGTTITVPPTVKQQT